MNDKENIKSFWSNYLKTLPANHFHRYIEIPESWSFGNSPVVADRLADLVVKRIKTATCSRYLGENILEDAGLSIILNGQNQPLCLIDTYEITIRQYQEIDEEWAKAEGDLSLEYWRKGHWTFFTSEAKQEGYTVSQDMLLSCERFRLIYSI